MMSFRVLISAPYMLAVIDRFRGRFERLGIALSLADVRERLEEYELLPLVGDIDGTICGDDRFTARVLEVATPRLRVISKWGTGIDSIDLEAARRLGVRVCNTPGAFTNPVADNVLAYVLAFARRIPWATASMRDGEWVKLPSIALNEVTLGIVGVGRIGSAVARRARVRSPSPRERHRTDPPAAHSGDRAVAYVARRPARPSGLRELELRLELNLETPDRSRAACETETEGSAYQYCTRTDRGRAGTD